MPSPETIVSALTATANEWRLLAVLWHAFFGGLVVFAVRGAISQRQVGVLLAAPFVSVSALAWAGGNPFNGAVFAAFAIVLLVLARHLPATPAQVPPVPVYAAGVLALAFGWMYPHFLQTSHWSIYAVAAPLGLVPCPTLAAAVGVTLMLGLFGSQRWSLALLGGAVAYGAIGVFWLGVTLDVGLLAAAATLGWALVSERRMEARA